MWSIERAGEVGRLRSRSGSKVEDALGASQVERCHQTAQVTGADWVVDQAVSKQGEIGWFGVVVTHRGSFWRGSTSKCSGGGVQKP